MKPFKTYRQQLTILRSRNMDIRNGSKAIRILEREGYYNVINGYKDIFIDEALTRQFGEDRYKQGTKFEHIYALYRFDRNIRPILFKYILMMEKSLKTKVSYTFSQHHKGKFNYLDINNFEASPKEATNLISWLSKVTTENTKEGNAILHYLDKHKELPIWVLSTRLTLGNIIHFYRAMRHEEKLEIVNKFIDDYQQDYKINFALPSENAEPIIASMFRVINEYRNICAHEERLFNHKDKDKGVISLFHVKQNQNYNAKLFDCILILGFFILKTDYDELKKSIIVEIKELEKELPSNIFNAVLVKMGFPKDWETRLVLP